MSTTIVGPWRTGYGDATYSIRQGSREVGCFTLAVEDSQQSWERVNETPGATQEDLDRVLLSWIIPELPEGFQGAFVVQEDGEVVELVQAVRQDLEDCFYACEESFTRTLVEEA